MNATSPPVMIASIRALAARWPRTPLGIASGVIIAGSVVVLAALGLLLVGVAAMAAVALGLSDDGSTAAKNAHAQLRVGMTYAEVNEVTSRLPAVHFTCGGEIRPAYPPCRRLKVSASGDWMASHSFEVALDEHGVVTGMSEPAWDYD